MAEADDDRDPGIDGRLYMSDRDSETRTIIISVKGGHVTASQVRDLRGVIDGGAY